MHKTLERSRAIAISITSIVLLALTLFAGCSPHVVGVNGEEDGHEAEHFVPLHFPQNAVAAIERLQALLSPDAAKATKRPPAGSDVTPRRETYDLARWLPELAAQTELDEPTWNQVRDASRTLEAAADQATGDAAPTGADVAFAIESLSFVPLAIREAEVSYRRQRGLEDSADLAVDAAKEPSSATTGPDS